MTQERVRSPQAPHPKSVQSAKSAVAHPNGYHLDGSVDKTYCDPNTDKPKPISTWIETANANDRELDDDEAAYDPTYLSSRMTRKGGKWTANADTILEKSEEHTPHWHDGAATQARIAAREVLSLESSGSFGYNRGLESDNWEILDHAVE